MGLPANPPGQSDPWGAGTYRPGTAGFPRFKEPKFIDNGAGGLGRAAGLCHHPSRGRDRALGGMRALHPLHKTPSPAALMDQEKEITLTAHSTKMEEVLLLLVGAGGFCFTQQSDLMMKLCLKPHGDK